MKNDLVDAEMLANLLRLGSLPESWIAPDSTRQLRELVRYRHKLCRLRTGLKAQLHSVLGKEGLIPPLRDMLGSPRPAYLDEISLGEAFEVRLESLRNLIAIHDTEIDELDRRIHRKLRDDAGYRTIQQLNGVGRVHAAAFVAEIGDVTRFPDPRRLCSWAGLTPATRVRHENVSGWDHQTRIRSGALVSGGSSVPLSRRRPDPGQLPPHRRPTRQQHRQGGRRPQTPHPGLLRVRDHEIRCLHTENDDMVEVA